MVYLNYSTIFSKKQHSQYQMVDYLYKILNLSTSTKHNFPVLVHPILELYIHVYVDFQDTSQKKSAFQYGKDKKLSHSTQKTSLLAFYIQILTNLIFLLQQLSYFLQSH